VIDRFAPVLFILGILIAGFGGLMLLPLSIAWLNADGAQSAYDEAVVITVCPACCWHCRCAGGNARCGYARASCSSL
jgi:hypothetical protein